MKVICNTSSTAFGNTPPVLPSASPPSERGAMSQGEGMGAGCADTPPAAFGVTPL